MIVDKNYIKDISDLYSLSKNQILSLDGFGEKSVENLLISIEQSKSQDFWRFITGLGIKHVGSSASKSLVRHYGAIDGLFSTSYEDLTSIDGVGELWQKVFWLFSDRNITWRC